MYIIIYIIIYIYYNIDSLSVNILISPAPALVSDQWVESKRPRFFFTLFWLQRWTRPDMNTWNYPCPILSFMNFARFHAGFCESWFVDESSNTCICSKSLTSKRSFKSVYVDSEMFGIIPFKSHQPSCSLNRIIPFFPCILSHGLLVASPFDQLGRRKGSWQRTRRTRPEGWRDCVFSGIGRPTWECTCGC